MTREEREKAIDALKISAPVMAVTQEEFNDYIQMLNKIMNWLEQERCDDCESPCVMYEKGMRGCVSCGCTDEEIAKSFIEDVEAVKDLLPETDDRCKECKEDIQEIKKALTLIIDSVRPDGDFGRFNFNKLMTLKEIPKKWSEKKKEDKK